MKTHTCVSIDLEKLMIAKKLGINISKILNDTLSAMIGETVGNPALTSMKCDLESIKEKEKALALQRANLMIKIEAEESKIQKYEEEELAQKIQVAKAHKNADILNEMLGP
jgi:hypothetical protein